MESHSNPNVIPSALQHISTLDPNVIPVEFSLFSPTFFSGAVTKDPEVSTAYLNALLLQSHYYHIPWGSAGDPDGKTLRHACDGKQSEKSQ